MPIDSPENDAVRAYMGRMVGSLEELNARIARVAIALGLSLDRPGEVERLLGQKPHVQEQSNIYSGPERRAQRVSHSGPERRKNMLYQELRGLLVLRYKVESGYAEQLGPKAMLHIVEQAQTNLYLSGFTPGAEGQDLSK